MKKRIIAVAGVAGLVGAVVLWPDLADAHHPEITVSSTCIGDKSSFVNIHTEAWKTWPDGTPVDSERRVNSNVVVTMTNGQLQDSGIVVGSGSFNAGNGFQFDLKSVQPTDVGPVTVRVTSVAPWGTNGQFEGAGEFREATVDLTDNCKFVLPSTTGVTTTTAGSNAGTTIVRDFPVTTTVVPPASTVVVTPRFAG